MMVLEGVVHDRLGVGAWSRHVSRQCDVQWVSAAPGGCVACGPLVWEVLFIRRGRGKGIRELSVREISTRRVARRINGPIIAV